MEYHIISKVQFIDNTVKYIPIGYTLNTDNCDIINYNYDTTLGSWVEINKTELENGSKMISEFFINTPYVYDARYSTTSIEGMGLSEITDVNEL